MKIIDGFDNFEGISQLEAIKKIGIPLARKRGRTLKITTEINKDYKVIAYINYGRWIAKCPWCNGADFVFKNEPYYFCFSCLNRAVDNKRIEVIFPKNINAIEQILLKRPLEINQNWLPEETIADLEKENKANGVI